MKNHRRRLSFGLLAALGLNLLTTEFTHAGSSPSIAGQPQNLMIPAGVSAAFSVSATGTPPLFYKWQKDGAALTDGGALAGSTTANLVFSSTTINDGGSYAVIITNSFGSVTSSVVKLTLGTVFINGNNIVVNGGFETGDLTGWGGWLIDYDFLNYEITTDNNYVKSGTYALQVGPPASLEDLLQTLPTQPGTGYLLSFWLNSTGDGPNEFKVTWNGSTIFDQTNLELSNWTNIQFIVTAATPSTALQFWTETSPSPWFVLDDISVTPIGLDVPKIQPPTQTAGKIQLRWNTVNTFPVVGYQVQYTTNLSDQAWINLGGVITGTNATLSATNLIGSDLQQFYRVQLVQ